MPDLPRPDTPNPPNPEPEYPSEPTPDFPQSEAPDEPTPDEDEPDFPVPDDSPRVSSTTKETLNNNPEASATEQLKLFAKVIDNLQDFLGFQTLYNAMEEAKLTANPDVAQQITELERVANNKVSEILRNAEAAEFARLQTAIQEARENLLQIEQGYKRLSLLNKFRQAGVYKQQRQDANDKKNQAMHDLAEFERQTRYTERMTGK